MRLTPLALALLLYANQACAAEQQVEAYNTYLYPPFVRDGGGGLAAELVARLNVQLAGKYQLLLVNLPHYNVLVFHAGAAPPQLSAGDDLKGLRFGGVLGNRYG